MSDDATPRPWQVEDNLPGSEGHVWIYAPNAADVWHRTIASVGDMEEIDGEDLANAAVIVRAVNCHDDLVASLSSIVERFERQVGGSDLWKQARAALEKARGDQNGR